MVIGELWSRYGLLATAGAEVPTSLGGLWFRERLYNMIMQSLLSLDMRVVAPGESYSFMGGAIG